MSPESTVLPRGTELQASWFTGSQPPHYSIFFKMFIEVFLKCLTERLLQNPPPLIVLFLA